MFKLGCEDSNLDRWLQRPSSCQLDDIPSNKNQRPTRASDRIRTGTDLFHRQALYQLSYTRQKCSRRDSNSDRALIWRLQGISLPLCHLSVARSAPTGTRTRTSHRSGVDTLFTVSLSPIELWEQAIKYPMGLVGLEPTSYGLKVRCLRQLGHRPNALAPRKTATSS